MRLSIHPLPTHHVLFYARVEKDVPADSKEAKKYLLSQTKSENVTPETSEVDQQPLPQLDPKPHLQGSCPQDKMFVANVPWC